MICNYCGEYWDFSDRECPYEPHPRKGDVRWEPVQFNGRWYAEEQVCISTNEPYGLFDEPEDRYRWEPSENPRIYFESEEEARDFAVGLYGSAENEGTNNNEDK